MKKFKSLPVWPEGFEKQEQWVLQSASADQPVRNSTKICAKDKEAVNALHEIQKAFAHMQDARFDIAKKSLQASLKEHPNNLLLARGINRIWPNILHQSGPNQWLLPTHKPHNIAVLIPGELRCMSRAKPLLQRISNIADIFITTSKEYRQAAEQLRPKALLVIEDQPTLEEAEKNLAVNSMKQWHKLSVCLRLMRSTERKRNKNYKHVLKWRTDYFTLQPQTLIKELKELDQNPNGGLIGASDKVFAGHRNTMLRLGGMWTACRSLFLDLDEYKWPINLEVILESDESSKWYGMSLPERLVGKPNSVAELRKILQSRKTTLIHELAIIWPKNEPLISLFPGDPRFPSEVAFARFLNLMAIPMRESAALRGFLYSDRGICK